MEAVGIILYQFFKVMFDHPIFQGIYVAALVTLIISAWGLFLPLNKSQEEKEKSFYPFFTSYGILMISTVYFLSLKQEGFHPLYHTGFILFITVGGIVTLVMFLQKLFNKQKKLDRFLN